MALGLLCAIGDAEGAPRVGLRARWPIKGSGAISSSNRIARHEPLNPFHDSCTSALQTPSSGHALEQDGVWDRTFLRDDLCDALLDERSDTGVIERIWRPARDLHWRVARQGTPDGRDRLNRCKARENRGSTLEKVSCRFSVWLHRQAEVLPARSVGHSTEMGWRGLSTGATLLWGVNRGRQLWWER